MPEVVVWGRLPPPLGGVTRCVQGLSAALDEVGVEHVVVDWRDRAAARHLLRSRRALHVHNVSSVLRLAFVMLAKLVSGARTVVYFHSGTLPDQLQSRVRRRLAQWGFKSVDAVWATNASLVKVIRDLAGVKASVVSPFSATRTASVQSTGQENSAVLFVGYGKELYGLDTFLEAAASHELSSWKFTVVAYGDEESCKRVQSEAARAGCRVLVNLDADGVSTVLAEHKVLVRPTTADGDAMIVREALAGGRRVVASNVVPRPAGAELVDLTETALVDALLNGAPVSDGEGLGPSVAEAVLAECRRLRSM